MNETHYRIPQPDLEIECDRSDPWPGRPLRFVAMVGEDGVAIAIFSYDNVKRALERFDDFQRKWDLINERD